MAYLLGRKEFWSLDLRVNSWVLIPRPDTEILVEKAIEILADPANAIGSPRVADIGTGSGAVALAIKKDNALPKWNYVIRPN